MMLELINPEELPTPASYTQVIAATGGRLVFVAGQVADDAQGKPCRSRRPGRPGPPGVRQRQPRPRSPGSRTGAGPEQVTKITIYVVHHRPEYLSAISEARSAVFGDHKPADTLVGVGALAEPGCLIEVDAIAVVD